MCYSKENILTPKSDNILIDDDLSVQVQLFTAIYHTIPLKTLHELGCNSGIQWDITV